MNEQWKGQHMSEPTNELLDEARALLFKAERSLARLSRRMPIIVKGIIANGDATDLGALRQMELQAMSQSAPGAAYLTVVQLHQALFSASTDAGLEGGPAPDGDDDIVIQSSGR